MKKSYRYHNARFLPGATLMSWMGIALMTVGCGNSDASRTSISASDPEAEAPSVTEPEFPVPSPSPSTLIADSTGWKELIITSDYAEIKVDPTGHWSISRNNCWVGGYGAMTLNEWNAFANPLNLILSARKVGEEKTVCIQQGVTPKSWKGPIELIREDGTKTSLFTQNYPDELCTDRDARSAALSLRMALDSILPRAFSEDCTMPLG